LGHRVFTRSLRILDWRELEEILSSANTNHPKKKK
jgi:hypothetical protein